MLALLSALVLGLAARARAESACVWDGASAAHYDLSSLIRKTQSYSIQDGDIECTTDVEEEEYIYLYNLCADVPDAPLACMPGAVLQVSEADSSCTVVGAYDEDKDESYWSLLDESNPAAGVRMTYLGEHCHHDEFGEPADLPRNFSILVPCDESVTDAVATDAIEPEHCIYELTMPSMYGCPTECGIAHGVVCGGHGHCDWDATADKARCFCNDGYEGSACSAETESKTSSTVVALLVALLCIAVSLVGVIFYMIRQLQAYRKDASNYMSLQMEMGALDADM